MEWLALSNWILVVAIALLVARVPMPSLSLQAFAVLAGLGTMIVFVSGGAHAFGWITVGLACAAFVALAVGSITLTADADGTMQRVKQSRKETAAGAAGLELPFLLTAALLSCGAVLA